MKKRQFLEGIKEAEHHIKRFGGICLSVERGIGTEAYYEFNTLFDWVVTDENTKEGGIIHDNMGGIDDLGCYYYGRRIEKKHNL